MIIWCMVPEILSTTDKIFCHFGLFFALLPPNNPKNQNFEKMKKIPGGSIILNMSTINENHMYDSWDIERDRIVSHFGTFFALLHPFPPNNPENQNFEKMKKTPGDIIILHKCTINDNHVIYGSWDMKFTRFFCHLEPFFALLPPNSLKNENLKKKKKKKWKKDPKNLEISSLYRSVPKIMIIGYTAPETWHITDVIIFQFGLYSSLLCP